MEEQKKELWRAFPAATPNCLILQFKDEQELRPEWRLVDLTDCLEKGLIDDVLAFSVTGNAIQWNDTGFRISCNTLYEHSQPMTPKIGVEPTADPTRFRLTITEDLPGALH